MKRLLLLLLPILIKTTAMAQKLPAFKLLRYDEDYSFLKNDSSKNIYTKLKFVPLSVSKKNYISFGGEIRYQYFYAKNETWGDDPEDHDGYVLTRWLTNADIHSGKYFRTFVQLQSSLANSKTGASPVENNPLDLHQAFIDINPLVSEKSKLTFRIGRQELLYGSQRIVAVRDGPNNRQSFDALRSIFTSGNYRVDVFFSHYVAAKPKIFDDGFNKNTELWGVYLVRSKLPVIKNIDLYYLGLWKKNTAFNIGKGKELRHSIGTRIWSSKNNWKYDVETLYQFGKFTDKNITAWTASVSTSYLFCAAKFKPELGLKTELISGDKNKTDNKLQTFNPIYPRGAYFGLAALIGAANLIDVHPSISFELSEKLRLDIDNDIFWRYTHNDGLYAVNMTLIYPDANTIETKIGNQLTSGLIYTPNGFLYLRGEFTWFKAGRYLKTVGAGKDILFTGFTVQLKF
ncbi:alginate export family protein [Ferruginibacter lapsinanis]|uniref:alginate export family protein n=1 Tax=Ferruginibacter lapsinanis TaxID=563172 RepID=UPI001E46F238|nr:alginate export family protein [Ferruginibacter lapsinanis]UEG50342.1 alginate export family protein [Ferruginibacter lapsinanis]